MSFCCFYYFLYINLILFKIIIIKIKERWFILKKNLFKGAGVALVTPMNSDGSINFKKLRELVNWHIENETDAIIVCGTTGESATLTELEHSKIIEETLDEARGRVCVIAGTGSNNTMHAVQLSKNAQKLGVDGILVVTPYYNKASQDGLFKHYYEIAQGVNLPLILYEVPSRTGCRFEITTLQKICREIDSVVAIKAASGDISQIAAIADTCGENLAIYSGNDDQIVPVLSLGGLGVISVLSNVVPKQTHEICQLFFDGEVGKSRKMQLFYLDLINALFIDVNPIAVKETLNLMGFDVGKCRLPLCSLDETKNKILIDCLKKYKLIRN